jgi:Tol biopolymer transport system component
MPTRIGNILWFSAFFSLFVSVLVTAQPAASSVSPDLESIMRSLSATKRFEQVAISPDGQNVAWVESAGDGNTAIFVAPAHAGNEPAKRITAAGSGFAAEGNIAWSPDSQRLAFLSDAAKSGQSQLCVSNLTDADRGYWLPGSARVVT